MVEATVNEIEPRVEADENNAERTWREVGGEGKPSRAVVRASISSLLELLGKEAENELSSRWRQGDLILEMKEQVGAMNAYREAAVVLCKSVRWSVELAKVADVFQPGRRRPGVEWSLYRVAANSNDPFRYLRMALDRRWSSKDLQRYLDSAREARTQEYKAAAQGVDAES